MPFIPSVPRALSEAQRLPFQPSPAQGVELARIEVAAAIADDFLTLQIEHVDAPVIMGGQQVRCHGEQLLGMPIRPLGNAATLADIPIAIGALAHRHNHFITAR